MDKSICPERQTFPGGGEKMTVTLELRGILSESEANHAMIHCEGDCNRMIAIGMIDYYFGSLDLAKRIAELHNQQPGQKTHPVKLVLQKLDK